MQNPANEITSVFSLLTMASSTDKQKSAVERYFKPDAGFQHPLCKVNRGAQSRNKILGIYQWYRVMSPEIVGEVKSVVYNQEENYLVLEVVQLFHIRLSPFKPIPSRLIVRLTLEESGGLHYISLQEDFYHPEHVFALVLPPFIPVISLVLLIATYLSNLGAMVAHAVGITGMQSSPRQDGQSGDESDGGLYDASSRRID